MLLILSYLISVCVILSIVSMYMVSAILSRCFEILARIAERMLFFIASMYDCVKINRK